MKQKPFSLATVGRALALLLLFSIPLASCSDDEGVALEYQKTIVPKADRQTLMLVNETGTLKVDELVGKWSFVPDGTFHGKLIIGNMKDEYKKYDGKVRVSGSYTPEYVLTNIQNGNQGISFPVHSLEITTIEPVN